jgi:tRNA/rRNA methyltransferase
MESSALERITVVLCRVESAGNVGAICRAMATMGCRSLVLADCPAYDEVAVKTMALNAWAIYEQAKRYDSLIAALEPCTYAAAFSRRAGRKRKEAIDIRDWAGWLANFGQDRIALVFGNERDGLNSAELACCDDAVFIPADAAQPSLNVSHAVQLACWELRRYFMAGTVPAASVREMAAARSQLDGTVQAVLDRMETRGFFKLGGREDAANFLREISARAALSPSELQRFSALLGKQVALAAKIQKTEPLQP